MKEEISIEIKTHLELTENKNTAYQKFLDTEKAMLKEKFIISNVCVRKNLYI